MARTMQYREWISGMNLRTAVASMAVAILLIVIRSAAAHAQTFTTLHGFNGMPDGAMPIGGLTMSAAGNLYGTTQYGGAEGWGMVFKLVHTGGLGSCTRCTVFLAFTIREPMMALSPRQGSRSVPDGNLYGTNTLAGAALTMAPCSNCRPRRRFAKAHSAPGPKPFFTVSPEAVTGECRLVRLCLTAPVISMAPRATAV